MRTACIKPLEKWFQFSVLIFILLFFVASYGVQAQQTAKRDENGRGYLEYLPPGYNDNNDLYPVIIFLHGQGERGDGSPGQLERVKRNGPPKHINNGHNMCFEYNGQEECFLVLSPQQTSNTFNWWAPDVMTFVETAIDNYRIDPSRIYLMGLSMGGQGTWRTAYSEENSDNIFAALAIAPGIGGYQEACKIAEDGTPVWAFHGTNDRSMTLFQGRSPINGMIACDADPAPIFTVYEGVGHNAWDRAFRTDNSLHTPNVYQWLLAQRMGEQPPSAPTVSAINDLELTLPENTVELTASANDSDGEIVSVLWEQISGPNNPTTGALDELELSLSGLEEGVYNYRITVTDNDNLTASDQVIITVLPEPVNIPPTVNAGNNRVITLPVNTITLNGSASDADGSIESTLWEQVSGPGSSNIVSPTNLTSEANNLIEGNYTFSLTATDNDGESVADHITITVQPEPPNIPPVAIAGENVSVNLPDNEVTIVGSGTDEDGTIEVYEWSQSSGPNTVITTGLGEEEITISNLIQGSYVFTFTVTDNDGDTDSDQVIINVLPPPPNDPPIANAGNSISITLPENSVDLQGTATDSDGTVVSYLWQQANGPGVANIASPAQEGTAVSDLIEGVYTFSFTVTDDDGDSHTDNVQVTVLPEPPNELPVVDAGNDRNITLPVSTVTLTANASDDDGTIVEYFWERTSGPNLPTFNSIDEGSTNISDLVEGVYQFTVTVTDDDGATASDQVLVTVFPEQNEAPIADAGDDISITLPISSAILAGSATDSDGAIDSYSWTQVTGPSAANIVDGGIASTEVTGLEEGIYRFRLTVTDDDGANDTDQMTLTVLPEPVNIPPSADAGNDIFLTLPQNSTTLIGQGSDVDGTIVQYVWNVIDAGNANIDDIDNFETQNLAISGLEEGVYVFSLTVVDDRGATGTDQVRVFVDTPNTPPSADAGQDVSITLPTNSVNLAGAASDADGNIIFTLWEQANGPNTASISNPTALNTTVNNLEEGIYIFNFYVEDDDGLDDIDEIRVTVNPAPPNAPPNVSAGNDVQVTLPVEQITLTGSANDSDGSISNLTWSQLTGPSTLTGQNTNTNSVTYTGLVEGVYTIRLTAIDNDGAQGSDDVRIVVLAAPGNQLPTVDAGTNITVTLPITSATLNGNAFDIDGSITSFNWTQISGSNAANIVTPAQNSTQVENLQEGIYTFRLTVVDDNGGEAFDQVNVRVNPEPANQPPVVAATTNKIINLPQSGLSLSATASDDDGSISTILWTQQSGPSAATLTNSSSLNLGVEDLILGTYVFRITVTDNTGVSAFDEVNVRVLEALANQPPTVSAGESQLIFSPESNVVVSGIAEDEDGSINSVLWTLLSGPNTPTIEDGNNLETGISGLILGTYVFRLEATDNQGLVGFDQVSIRVNEQNLNLPPSAYAGENKVLVLPQNTTLLEGEVSDPDGGIQSIQWVQEFGPGSATLTGADQVNLEVSDLIAGFYVFRMTVTDNNGATDFDDVSVTVNNAIPKSPPVVNAGEDIQVILPDENIQLQGTATNTDGTIVEILWEQLSGPSVVAIEDASVFETSVSVLEIGTYVFRLIVKNSENLQNFDLITIHALANQAPFAFTSSDTTLILPVTDFVAKGQGIDNDGTITEIEWQQLTGPNTAVIGNATTSETSISNLIVGKYQLEFRVTDDKGAESFDILNIEVIDEAENIAPIANAGEDIFLILPQDSATLSGQSSDADGTIATIVWRELSGPNTAVIDNPDADETNISGLIAGSYQFEYRVIDDNGAESFDIVNVEVSNEVENMAPVITMADDITIQLPENAALLSADTEDLDGNITQYQWEKVEGGEFSFVTPNQEETLVENLERGNYLFRLVVDDNDGLQSTGEIRVFVVAPEEPPVVDTELTKLFTPNGDGINDLWVSEVLEELGSCSITIFNRLGVKIFEEENYQNNWNGSDQNGRIVDDGAYFYILSCENNFIKKGGVRIKK